MKKLTVIFATVLAIFGIGLSGCKNATLQNFVSEYRKDILVGQSDCPIKAYVITKEDPMVADGIVSPTKDFIRFILDVEDTDANYLVCFSFGGKDYSPSLSLNALSGHLNAEIVVENFDQKSLEVTLKKGAERTEYTLFSVIPEKIVTLNDALSTLEREQTALIKSFYGENGQFNAEIIARILMKNDKPYWYIGLVSNTTKKALLIDASNGQILAIRDIFGD